MVTMTGQKDLHVRLSKEVYTKLKVKCAYQGISMQDYIVKLVVDDAENGAERKRSILIVDDESIVRNSLRDWLKDSYNVTAVESGEQAVELIRKNDFDIMVLDVRLTGKSGIQVLREVKAIKPYIKSIVITAFPSVELAVEAMKEGAVDYIVKPVIAEELERLVWQTILKCK